MAVDVLAWPSALWHRNLASMALGNRLVSSPGDALGHNRLEAEGGLLFHETRGVWPAYDLPPWDHYSNIVGPGLVDPGRTRFAGGDIHHYHGYAPGVTMNVRPCEVVNAGLSMGGLRRGLLFLLRR